MRPERRELRASFPIHICETDQLERLHALSRGEIQLYFRYWRNRIHGQTVARESAQ